MGKRTPKASQAQDNQADDAPTTNCPLNKPGHIKVTALWAHDRSPAKKVAVSIDGQASKSKKTSSNGQALFKKVPTGAYTWTTDYTGVGDTEYLLTTADNGNCGVTANNTSEVQVLVTECGRVKVEVREAEEDGTAGALLDGTVMESVKVCNLTRKGQAEVEFDSVPAGQAKASVVLASTDWRLVNGQTLTATVERGKTVTLVVRAEEIADIRFEVVDVTDPATETKVQAARVNLKRDQRQILLVTVAAGTARHIELRDGPGFEIESVERPNAGRRVYSQLVGFETT
jgi:hypothetical protein